MGIWNVWLETRGTVIRREFEDAIAKTPGDRTPARFAFLNHAVRAPSHNALRQKGRNQYVAARRVAIGRGLRNHLFQCRKPLRAGRGRCLC